MDVITEQDPQQYYRQCPGEPYKISDAVCVGRRRTHYPKCKGCVFNDDERGAKASVLPLAGTKENGSRISSPFKAYDVRGTYPDMVNEELAWRIGHGTSQYLRSLLSGYDRSDENANTVVVGRDMRSHSPDLAQALAEGIIAAGGRVADIGMVDTPQVYFAINHLNACGGVQVTASHNPAQYNGFKISGQHARPIGEQSGLHDIEKLASAVRPNQTGDHTRRRQIDLAEPYKQHVRQYLTHYKPLPIAIDASNGMAGKILPEVFGDLDWKLTPLNFDVGVEFVHEPNPLVDANLKQLQEAVVKGRCKLGVCFDGDADRCMFVDENAQIIRCDKITALLAEYFLRDNPGSTIVYDLRSSWSVRDAIKNAGGEPKRERVGHAFMKQTLRESNGVFGGELSGHFYFRDNFFADSGMLVLVHTLNVMGLTGKPLSELIAPFQRYHASGEINFEVRDKDGMIRQLAGTYRNGEVDWLDGVTAQFDTWWFNVRKSNTEPLLRLNIEAKSKTILNKQLRELKAILGKPVKH